MEADEKVKRLYKSRTDRMIDGVCGGIAEYVGVDPVLVRIAFLLLAFAGGVGIIVYIIGMILMPAGSLPAAPVANAVGASTGSTGAASAVGESVSAAAGTARPSGTSDSTARIIGIGFVVLGGLLLLGNLDIGWHHWWGLSWSAIAPILIIAAGVALVLRSPTGAAAPQASGREQAGQEGSAGATGGSASFAAQGRRLHRARMDRKFLGICGGLGTYLSVDPTILRLLFVISAIASFGGTVLLYLITAIVIPAEPLEARPA